VNRSTVNTIEMKRACERLLARLSDERDSGNSSVVFTAEGDSLCIQVGDSSETIPALVAQSGKESIQCLQFSGMAQTLRFYRKKKIEVTVSDNELKIERMVFRPLTHEVMPGEQ
jgi:hypothetical protein